MRELENIIEYAFVLCSAGRIGIEHLPSEIRQYGESNQPAEQQKTMRDLEAEFIADALRINDWNRLRTAQSLSLHKSTLYRKIKKLGVILPEKDGRYKSKL